MSARNNNLREALNRSRQKCGKEEQQVLQTTRHSEFL